VKPKKAAPQGGVSCGWLLSFGHFLNSVNEENTAKTLSWREIKIGFQAGSGGFLKRNGAQTPSWNGNLSPKQGNPTVSLTPSTLILGGGKGEEKRK